jgi:hypothetical protein
MGIADHVEHGYFSGEREVARPFRTLSILPFIRVRFAFEGIALGENGSSFDERAVTVEPRLPFAAQGANVREPGRALRVLKDGYWDRTELVEMPDGSRRVRKSSNGDAPPGPWGVTALRREIAYLKLLPESARSVFPPVLGAWDEAIENTLAVGYEVPFYAQHVDAGELARRGALEQAEIDAFQDVLATALFEKVHAFGGTADSPLSTHVRDVVNDALAVLEGEPDLARLIRAPEIRLNQRPMAGPRAAFARLVDKGELAALDGEPQVLLHGDCFLENLPWRPNCVVASGGAPQLLLIDPVSVAGVSQGPPLFDLVKYLSYATGELPALRGEWVSLSGFEGEERSYVYALGEQDPRLAPYRTRDWYTRLQRAFEAKYGQIDGRLFRIIDGYFSVAMAVNTGGLQRRARLLKATLDFNAAIGE